MCGVQAVTEPTPTSAANYQRVKDTLTDLLDWTSAGTICDGLADVLQERSRSEGKCLYDFAQALYACRVASGLPGYYLPPQGGEERI